MSREPPRTLPLLIRTKLSPPRLTRPPVRREVALQSLSAGRTRALTLIKAPAGFGKTTLLTTWREKLLEEQQIVAWLTLDQDDNDANRFIDYLIGALADALGTLADDTPELANSGKMVSVKIQMTSIINALVNIGREITLMLDDYDKIDDPSVHDLVAFLLRHIPANLHIVAACRATPPLPLASLRARDQLVELNTDSMRFGVEDTETFFSKSISIKLSPDETRAIHDATEGWVAGLQIATLVMPGRNGLHGLISAFPRHSRALTDYLAENVLTQIPAGMVDFMLRTSVLDRLNGGLCEHLTGTENAAEKLEWLVTQNLFLQPLDEDGLWYRYHGLFSDFLRSQLNRKIPNEIQTLHLRAAEWLSEQQLWAEAVRHALDADRVDLAADWLERCALGELSNGRVQNFLSWVQKLPPDAIRERLSLRVMQVWALILTVQPAEARALVAELREQLRKAPPENAEVLSGILRAQCVSIMSMQDDISAGLELGRKIWLERFPNKNKPTQGFDWVDEAFLNAMLHLYRKTGDLDSARRVADFYCVNQHVAPNLLMMSYQACLLATLEIQEKQMHSAARRLNAALDMCEQHAGRRSAAAALLAASLASIYYDWNRLDAVEDLLADRFDIIDDVCFIEPIEAAYLSLARVRVARGKLDDAQAILARAESLAERRNWPRLTAACISEQIRLWLNQNKISEAERALIKLDEIEAEIQKRDQGRVDVRAMNQSSHARLLIKKGRFVDAQDLLGAALDNIERNPTAETPYEIAQLRTQLAIAYYGSGNREFAQKCLLEVIELTEPDGVVRLLADEGTAISPILDALIALEGPKSPRASYYDNVFVAMGGESAVRTANTFNLDPELDKSSDDDALSRRESDVLDLVAQQLSNKQIARTLFITPETVKWHLRNIYRKLGVSDRRRAARFGKQTQLGPQVQ